MPPCRAYPYVTKRPFNRPRSTAGTPLSAVYRVALGRIDWQVKQAPPSSGKLSALGVSREGQEEPRPLHSIKGRLEQVVLGTYL